MKDILKDKRKLTIGYWIARGLLLLIVMATFVPFVVMLLMSIKENINITTDFWSLPEVIVWRNYTKAFTYIVRPICNSLFIALCTIAVELVLVGMSGYAFGRHKFYGKNVIFIMFIGVMMIPNVLMVVPLFLTVNRLGLMNNYLALVLPYISGLQLFGILLARSFFASLPEEMFEAAKIEGAGEMYIFTRIAVPLSVSILISVGITSLIAIYNDYVWPTLVISGETRRTFSQAVFTLSNGYFADYGLITAGYVIGTIPMLIITGSCLKYYMKGLLEGAIKG